MEYDNIRSINSTSQDDLDCSVIAVSVVTGITYQQASAKLTSAGRIKNKGFAITKYHRVIEDLGFTIEAIHLVSKTVRTVERELAVKWGNTKVLINTYGHVLAWNGKEIVDWTGGRLHRVRAAFVVYPKNTAVVAKSVSPPIRNDLNRSSWTVTKVSITSAELDIQNKIFKSLPAAYKALGFHKAGRQKIRRILKMQGSIRFRVWQRNSPADKWMVVLVTARIA